MAREKGMDSLQLEKTGGGGQRRRGIPAASSESSSRDRYVASPLCASPLAVTLPRREVTPGTMSGGSPLTPEMMGELRKMYEVLKGVFG